MDIVLEQIAVVFSFVERAVQFVKPLYQGRFPEHQKHIDAGLAAALNIALCSLWNVDLFAAAGFGWAPFWGEVLTGVVASLGSTVLHELVEILKLLRRGPVPEG